MRSSSIQPLTVAKKKEFTQAINNGGSTTNIYGWLGEIPKPGCYRQGGSIIQIFRSPKQGNVIGLAVSIQ